MTNLLDRRPEFNPDECSDNELVAMTLDNQEMFAGLVRRYEAKLKRYILRLSNIDDEEADDVLQDIFIKVYKNLNDFDKDLKFSSWIYRIAHNQVISHHRKIIARPQTTEIDDVLMNKLKAEFDLEKQLQINFTQKEVNDIISALKPAYREVLVLKFLEEKSYEEISDILTKPSGTVATLIYNAKKEFRKKWEEEHRHKNIL
jgi:RNA polymerase sigma-70 factor (ECF subfamily)